MFENYGLRRENNSSLLESKESASDLIFLIMEIYKKLEMLVLEEYIVKRDGSGVIFFRPGIKECAIMN